MSSDVLQSLANEFYPYAQQRMGFDQDAHIEFVDDSENAQDPLGKTAYYDPQSMTVTLFVSGRHPKDILRSLSHELVHHTQNCRGEFSSGVVASEGYAQTDSHLREMEKEAYEQGNLVFRDWEDERKSKRENLMEHFDKRRLKLNDELMKRFGLKKKPTPTSDKPTKETKENDK